VIKIWIWRTTIRTTALIVMSYFCSCQLASCAESYLQTNYTEAYTFCRLRKLDMPVTATERMVCSGCWDHGESTQQCSQSQHSYPKCASSNCKINIFIFAVAYWSAVVFYLSNLLWSSTLLLGNLQAETTKGKHRCNQTI
jgi:hypothetical protein